MYLQLSKPPHQKTLQHPQFNPQKRESIKIMKQKHHPPTQPVKLFTSKEFSTPNLIIRVIWEKFFSHKWLRASSKVEYYY